MKNRLRANNISDDYHTLDRAGQVTLIGLCTGHNRLNSHMHRRMNLLPSLCTCGTEDQAREHILQICPSHQHLREHIWSDGTPLHQKLYGKEEEQERTVGFIQQAGLSVYSIEREEEVMDIHVRLILLMYQMARKYTSYLVVVRHTCHIVRVQSVYT